MSNNRSIFNNFNILNDPSNNHYINSVMRENIDLPQRRPEFIDYNYNYNIPVNFGFRNYGSLRNLNLNHSDNDTTQQALSRSLYENNKYKMVISEEALKSLSPTIYRNLNQTDQTTNPFCCISQEEFKDDDEVIQLHCSHVFHKDAILHWLTKENPICPVCRYKYAETEIKNIDEDDTNSSVMFTENIIHNDDQTEQQLFSVFELLEQLRYDSINGLIN